MDALPAESPVPALVKRVRAGEPGSHEAQLEQVVARLRAALPATRFEAVERSALPGFFLVRLADNRVAYTDRNARFLVLGIVFDLSTGKALDQQLDAVTQ